MFDYSELHLFHDRIPVMLRAAYDLNHTEPWKYFIEFICRHYLGYDYAEFYKSDLVDELRRQNACLRALLPAFEEYDLGDPLPNNIPPVESQVPSKTEDLAYRQLIFASVHLQAKVPVTPASNDCFKVPAVVPKKVIPPMKFNPLALKRKFKTQPTEEVEENIDVVPAGKMY